MFTGLIEAVGEVRHVGATDAGLRIRIRTAIAPDLSHGESVSVNGVCLTVAQRDASEFTADIGPETARVTTLAALQHGQAVNLERAMRADGRFGGHFVQGHVDGIGTVLEAREDDDAHWLKVGFPRNLAPLFIRKGSVAIDGISLTVADLRDTQLDVMIIPFTWQATNLASRQVGDT